MQIPSKVPYNARWQSIAFGAFLFSCSAILFAREALLNKKGVVIDGVVTLGIIGATRFYWILSLLSLALVLVAAMLAIRRATVFQELEIDKEGIVLPHGLFQMKRSRIRYEDIVRISEMKVSSQTLLYIHTRRTKVAMGASLLPDKSTYFELREFLTKQIDRRSRA